MRERKSSQNETSTAGTDWHEEDGSEGSVLGSTAGSDSDVTIGSDWAYVNV